jgi:polar amino acid transport system substrate-binding protein
MTGKKGTLSRSVRCRFRKFDETEADRTLIEIDSQRFGLRRAHMKLFLFCTALLFAMDAGSGTFSDGPTPSQRWKVAPTGKLRVGVVSAPAKSALFVVKDAGGEPRGVTVDLGKELARKLGVPIEFFVASNSGELVDAMSSAAIDVTFMPIDDERRERVDFGPAYFIVESTYLVRAGSDIKSLSEVDRPNVRVVGIANTATLRGAACSLKNTTIAAVKSIGEATEMLRAGTADAFALTHDALPPLAARLPGSRILDGSFLQTGIDIAVPKNRPNALAYVTAFMENARHRPARV